MPVTLKSTLVHANDMIDPKSNAIVSKTEEISSDDDFIPTKKATKQFIDLSSSEDEIYTQSKTAKVVITEVFPDNYDYNFFYSNTTTQAHITVVLDLSYNQREDARKWVADYNDKTKETGL